MVSIYVWNNSKIPALSSLELIKKAKKLFMQKRLSRWITLNIINICHLTLVLPNMLQPRGSHLPNRPSLISSGGRRGSQRLLSAPSHAINTALTSQRTKPLDSIPTTSLTPDHTIQQNSRNRLLWLPGSTNTSYFIVFKQQLSEQIFLSVQPPTAPIERGK